VPTSIFIQDQSTTNALATGDSQSFALNVSTNGSALPLRLTLAWTDPPGNPVAAIKLVNSLELVVTNVDNPTNPVVYYGNDIPAHGVSNTPESATNSVSPDTINNVQNVVIPEPLGTNYVRHGRRARGERQRRLRPDEQRRRAFTRPTWCRITRW
jgi:hypothetical protein